MPAVANETYDVPGDGFGKKTETATTPITRLIPPKVGFIPRVFSFVFECGATADTVTLMTTQDSANIATAAVVGATTLTITRPLLTADSTPMAASDWIVYQQDDGTWKEAKITSVSGSVVTIPATTKAVLINTRVYLIGAPADHADRQFSVVAMVRTDFSATIAGLATGPRYGEPILVHAANAVTQGTVHLVEFGYVKTL
jgi:hypothetical protein